MHWIAAYMRVVVWKGCWREVRSDSQCEVVHVAGNTAQLQLFSHPASAAACRPLMHCVMGVGPCTIKVGEGPGHGTLLAVCWPRINSVISAAAALYTLLTARPTFLCCCCCC